MPRLLPPQALRYASTAHARLLDRFIAMIQQEMAQSSDPFTIESLDEWMETLRAQRREYGVSAGVSIAA